MQSNPRCVLGNVIAEEIRCCNMAMPGPCCVCVYVSVYVSVVHPEVGSGSNDSLDLQCAPFLAE